jgi:hypothetical protein
LELPPEEFAAGCNLLQAAAIGDIRRVEEMLKKNPRMIDFRDYDRRVRAIPVSYLLFLVF